MFAYYPKSRAQWEIKDKGFTTKLVSLTGIWSMINYALTVSDLSCSSPTVLQMSAVDIRCITFFYILVWF